MKIGNEIKNEYKMKLEGREHWVQVSSRSNQPKKSWTKKILKIDMFIWFVSFELLILVLMLLQNELINQSIYLSVLQWTIFNNTFKDFNLLRHWVGIDAASIFSFFGPISVLWTFKLSNEWDNITSYMSF